MKNTYHFCITITFYVFQDSCSLYCLLTPGQIPSRSPAPRLRCPGRTPAIPRCQPASVCGSGGLRGTRGTSTGDLAHSKPRLPGQRRNSMQRFQSPSQSPNYPKCCMLGRLKAEVGLILLWELSSLISEAEPRGKAFIF